MLPAEKTLKQWQWAFRVVISEYHPPQKKTEFLSEMADSWSGTKVVWFSPEISCHSREQGIYQMGGPDFNPNFKRILIDQRMNKWINILWKWKTQRNLNVGWIFDKFRELMLNFLGVVMELWLSLKRDMFWNICGWNSVMSICFIKKIWWQDWIRAQMLWRCS